MLAWVEERSFSGQSPEAHARIRRLFQGALTPRAVRRMDAQIREVVERFAKPLRDRPGEVLDLMAEFTNPIPNSVISRVTGVPPGADEVRFRELAQAVLRGLHGGRGDRGRAARDGGLGAGDGCRAPARARRGPDLRPAAGPDARRDARGRRDRAPDLAPDRRGKRDDEHRRARPDPDPRRP